MLLAPASLVSAPPHSHIRKGYFLYIFNNIEGGFHAIKNRFFAGESNFHSRKDMSQTREGRFYTNKRIFYARKLGSILVEGRFHVKEGRFHNR